jgi:hypothetical protein
MFPTNKKPRANNPGARQAASRATPRLSSTFFHPDFTVGPGFSPDLPLNKTPGARGLGHLGHTAGRESGAYAPLLCPEGAISEFDVNYSTVDRPVKYLPP